MEKEKRPARAWKKRGIFALVSSRLPDAWEDGAEEAGEDAADPEREQT